jgi:hypothetical protein
VINATPCPLYSGKDTRYPFYTRLCGPQDRSGRVRKVSPLRGIFFPMFSFLSFVRSFLSIVYLHLLCPYVTYSSRTHNTLPCLHRIYFLYSHVLCFYIIRTSLFVLSCILPIYPYLQHTTQTSISPLGFELATPAGEGPQTLALDGSASGIG